VLALFRSIQRLRKSRIFKLVTGTALLAACLAGLVYVAPLSGLIPQVEQQASYHLGLPVRISDIHLQLFPTPRVAVGGIRIGTGDIELDKVTIVPALSTLFDDTRVIRVLEVSGMSVRDSIFGKLALAKKTGATAGATPVKLERVSVTHMKVASGSTAIVIDTLSFSIQKQAGRLDITDLKSRLYGGEATGQARMEQGRQSRLAGDFSLKGVDIGSLSKAVAPRPVQTMTGRLAASGRFTALAPTPGALADALQLDGKFSVANGVLHNFDFASAVKSAFTGKVKGGETRFDDLHGDIALRGRNVQVRNLVISSGILAAKGRVDVSAGGQLSGVVDVDLKNTMGFVGVPVALSGTLKEPQLGMTTGTKIGAAAGTVLAPGVGTSLGASIGRFFEKKTAR
jgi:uncharacterized protein involved in outer membrane biogenesis